MNSLLAKLLDAVAVTGPGPTTVLRSSGDLATFQVVGGTTAGAGAVSVNIEVSNDGANWMTVGAVSLVLSTTASSDGFVSTTVWPYTRANVVSISGTGASVSATMGR